MLDSTMELISLAASNSLAVFCFCNLIIAFLLVGTSKSQFHEDKLPNATPTIANAANSKKNSDSLHEEETGTFVESKEEDVLIGNMSTVDNEEDNLTQEEPKEEGDDNEDELRKRVEEFIEKINSGWKAEKLKT